MGEYSYRNINEIGTPQVLDQANKLRAFLQQKTEADKQQQQFEQEQQLKKDLPGIQEQAAQAGIAPRLEQLQTLKKQYPGQAIEIGKDSVKASPIGAMLTQPLKEEALMQKGQADYSKRLEKVTDFSSTLKQLEDLTNRDGQGGILTNPNAKLMSTGKLKSNVPDSLMGLGELVGATDKGTMEERKALGRLAIDFAHAKGGVRGLSPQIMAKEREALGWVSSDDPNLVSKGVRSLAKTMQGHLRTIKSGYTPDVQDRVHSIMGDPESDYSQIYEDTPTHNRSSKGVKVPQMSQTSPTPAPQVQGTNQPQPPETPEQEYLRLKQKYNR